MQLQVPVTVQVQDEQDSPTEGVTLRPRSSQQLRLDGAGRARTCFLYPPGGRTGVNSAATGCDGGNVLKQGPLERVKVGGARRLPRHWDRQRFACLASDGRLCMSEDAAAAVETAQNPVAAAKRTDGVTVDTVFTGGALVVRGSMLSSKKNVIELTEPDGRKTLIQNDEAVTTDSWFEALSRAAAGPRLLRGGSLPRSADGRSGSGNEATGAHSAAHDASVRSALGRFFGGGRRPTRESLETRGIYRDEPVFGSRLCALGSAAGGVPFFVRECTHVLGAEPHVLQPGLYRISGNLSRIQRLRLRVDQSAASETDQRRAISLEQDTDVLAGALKLFFRELRDPLLPYAAYTKLLSAIEQSRSEDARLKTVRQLFRDERLTPTAHVATLALLCRHLALVCSYERHNQMTATSMAIVWGPSLTWPANANQDALLQCTRVNRVIEYLITNEHRLFDH